MKKFLLTIAAALTFTGISFAQSASPASQTTTKTAVHTTKTGAADKRYKENKKQMTTTTQAGPTKKDGTPDMRYKANKKTTAVKTSTTK